MEIIDQIIEEAVAGIAYRDKFGVEVPRRDVAAYEMRRAHSRQFCPQVALPAPIEVII